MRSGPRFATAVRRHTLMTHPPPDFYSLLGLDRGASAADVDRAYRRAARATHPDIHRDDPSAADRFRAVTVAHETLSDPERRASYDAAHRSLSPDAPVRIVVHRRPAAASVHVGRRPPDVMQPFHTDPTIPLAGGLHELVEALARVASGWPFR